MDLNWIVNSLETKLNSYYLLSSAIPEKRFNPFNSGRARFVKDSWGRRGVGDILLHGNPWSFEGNEGRVHTCLVGIE